MTASAFMNLPKDLLAKCNTPINMNSMPSKKESDMTQSISAIKQVEKQRNFDKNLANLELHKTKSKNS